MVLERPKEKAMTSAVQHDFLVRLGDREQIAERTIACRLEKPADFAFKPGQFVEITLLNPPETDAEGNSRAFSIASSPRDDFLLVATRLRESAFKRVLSHAPQGTPVKIDGPFGDLRLHNDSSRTAVMLCGGIGITPFRSIIVNATENKLPHRIFLFYSNRRPEDAPFLEELQALEKQNPRFTLIGCMTEMERSRRRWDGERGKINRQMLEKYLGGLPSAIYYITGPPGFVAGMRTMLAETGIDDDNVRTEEFGGY
jgi:ferredoxin-NADP reductase